MRATVLVIAMICSGVLDAQQVSTARRQQDLDFIANQLPRLHANFFFQLDPAQYQQATL